MALSSVWLTASGVTSTPPLNKFEFVSVSKADRQIAELELKRPADKRGLAVVREIGWKYLVSGRPERALQWFDRLLASDKFCPDDFVSRSVALYQLGRIDEARADCFWANFHFRMTSYPQVSGYWNKESQMFPSLIKAFKKAPKGGVANLDQALVYEAVCRVSKEFYYTFIQTRPYVKYPELKSFGSNDPFVSGFFRYDRDLDPFYGSSEIKNRDWMNSMRADKEVVEFYQKLRSRGPVGTKAYQTVIAFFAQKGETAVVLALSPEDAALYDKYARELLASYHGLCVAYTDGEHHFQYPVYEPKGAFGDDAVVKQADRDKRNLWEATLANERALQLDPKNKDYLALRDSIKQNTRIQRGAEEAYLSKKAGRDLTMSAIAYLIFYAAAGDGETDKDEK